MYRSLKRTIETFLGKEFYGELAAAAEKRGKSDALTS